MVSPGQALKMTLVREWCATDRKRGWVILLRLKQKAEAGEMNPAGNFRVRGFFFSDGVSCDSGWPRTCYAAKHPLSLPSFQHAGTMLWPTGWPRQPCFCNDWYFTGWETQEPSDFQWVIKDTVGSMAGASSNANPLRSSLGTVWRGPTYDSMERHSERRD